MPGEAELNPLFTPDGRYLIVRDRLWRAANPGLSAEARSGLVNALMTARREVGIALRNKDGTRLAQARIAVHAAKVALGERGAVWWTDGTRDFNRCLVKNTPYAEWYLGTQAMK
ncbi:hypothetical protein [Pseudoxanthomonas yeongjuensis]|uniref:hypothetical protein n=1 Tax=Pseudoxanthomonas yeongjuensis TaxID=377616 RepID=UPI003CCCFD70